ncbi:hypothetical protein ES703_07693 [subsurface metagenome]
MLNNFPRLTPIMKDVLAKKKLGRIKKFKISFVFFNSLGLFCTPKNLGCPLGLGADGEEEKRGWNINA